MNPVDFIFKKRLECNTNFHKLLQGSQEENYFSIRFDELRKEKDTKMSYHIMLLAMFYCIFVILVIQK